MLSLNDQISTFRKRIEALNINDYTPIYHSLSQQQITIKEVIAQNSLIVESVKMMNEVFKNYCWLNDRIYGKIIEHQLNLHSQNIKLTSLTYNIEHKIDDSIKNARSVYQQTSHKNRKIKQMVQSGLKQIYDQIKTKVNDSQLSDIIKQIIIKYDQGEFIKQEAFQSIDNVVPHKQQQIASKYDYHIFNTLSQSPTRKTGKVGYEDYYKLKDQIEHHFVKLKRQITELQTENSHHKDKFSKISLNMDNHISQIIKNKTEINKLGAQNKNSTTLYMKQIQKLQLHMKEYMSEEEWKKRFRIFEIRAIDPIKLHFNEGLTQLKNDLKKLKEDVYYKVNMSQSLVKQYGQQMHNLAQKVAKQIQQAAILQNRFKEVQYRIQRDNDDTSRKIEEFTEEVKRSNKDFQKTVKKELNEVKTTILKLSNSVEQKAYKAISKKIQTSFQSFQIDLMQNRQFVKNLTTSISLANDQIKTVKDILSKKANFSDVVHYVQGKADRIDMKQMGNKLQESLANSKPLTTRQLSDTFNLRQGRPKQATTRFRPASKTHKTQVIAFPASQRSISKSKQHSSSRGRMQLQATARKLLVRDNKNKITKSYTSLISDLRN